MMNYLLRRNIAPIATLLICLGCAEERKGPAISTTPASIRGWLVDPGGGSPQQVFHLSDTASGDAAHRARVFEQTNLAIEGYPYASGGMAANGAFIILDVPPGDVTVTFQPPEGTDAQLFMKGVPANADVLLGGLKIEGSTVTPVDPSKIVVRVPARVETPRPLATTVTVAGHKVQVVEVPVREMIDRREFPNPS